METFPHSSHPRTHTCLIENDTRTQPQEIMTNFSFHWTFVIFYFSFFIEIWFWRRFQSIIKFESQNLTQIGLFHSTLLSSLDAKISYIFFFFIESTIRIFFCKITFYYCLCSLTIALVIFTLKFLSNWQLSYLNFKIHKLFHSSICWKKRVRFQVRAKKNYEWWKISRAFGRLWKISSGIIFLRTQACWNVEGAWNGEELLPCAFKILMLDEGKQIHKRDEQLRQSRLEENIFRINLFCFFVKRWVIKSLKPKVSLTLKFL